ncbi:MAG: TolC family protein [candidate division KSB1 bacterium]|nr:TolC family protein [candidate division KSB1 bacterium]MDZ7365611.1 TolC family protein [candidate division KSB1 bacterium]MDZ7403313.1 TolC family protein [candidate division KSB1 bacterium]
MKKYLLFLFLPFVAGVSRAQTPLELEEALRLARQNNLQLHKQQQKQKIAELEAAIKRSQRLPSLDFSAMASYTDEIAKLDIPIDKFGLPLPPNFVQPRVELGGHDRTDIALGVRQPIFTGAKLRTQVELAQNALEAEQTRLALLQQQTAYQVHLLFYQAQSLKKERRIQEASLTRLEAQLRQARSLFGAAQVMAHDTLQVYNQTLQLKIQMDQNQRDQRLVDLQMYRLLDLPEARPIAETELSKPPVFRAPLDSLKRKAMQLRPELNGVRLGQRRAQLNRKLAKAAYFPDVGAEVKYHYGKPGLNQVTNEWMDYATVGVSLQWNLWRWQQDRRRVEAAEVERNRLTLEEREWLRAIDFEVERSWEEAGFAVKQIELAERLLAQQQERYRIVSTQQREGVATTNDVIVAEADLTQAELQLQRAVIQYYLAQSGILLATGTIGSS